MYARDAGAREHLGNELDTLAAIRTGGSGRNFSVERLGRQLPQAASQVSGSIMIELASRWIGRVVVHVSPLQCERVDIRSVPAAMLNKNGVMRRGGIQIGSIELASLGRFRIVVFES